MPFMKQNLFRFVPKGIRNPLTIFRWLCRDLRLRSDRRRLAASGVSIISDNCLGGMICHDYCLPQLSPTVNLFILPTDFIDFCSNLEANLDADVVEVKSDEPYPVGAVNGCVAHFSHYKTISEAREAWKRRAVRVNPDRMLVLMVERDGCTYDDLKRFDALPFPDKMVLVHRPYPEIGSAVVVPGYADSDEVGILTDWSGLLGKRKYDVIDWVEVLNGIGMRH